MWSFLQCTFPPHPCTLLSHSYHSPGSYLCHTCPQFLQNKMLLLFVPDIVNHGCQKVAYGCMFCCYGPYRCLLPQPCISHLHFWISGFSVLESFQCLLHHELPDQNLHNVTGAIQNRISQLRKQPLILTTRDLTVITGKAYTSRGHRTTMEGW